MANPDSSTKEMSSPNVPFNIIEGTDGNDNLSGLDGPDLINGGRGDDIIHGNDGDDELKGGDGQDTLYGDAGDDILSGGNGYDVIDGGDGADVINYRLDHDEADGYKSNGFVINLRSGETRTRTDSILADSLSNIEHVTGSHSNDVIIGTDEFNILLGGAGYDTIYGGGGNDTLSGGLELDTIDGGDGQDLIDYRLDADEAGGHAGSGFRINLETGETRTRADNLLADHLSSIENVTGSYNNDMITGNAGNNVLLGSTGIDTINGGAGDDTLSGGWNHDIIDGGDGMDTIDYTLDSDEADGHAGSGFNINLVTGETRTRIDNILADSL